MRRGEYKCRKWGLHVKLRDQQLKTTLYIHAALSKAHRKCKQKNYDRYTLKKRKSNLNTTIKMVIKQQEQRIK